MERHHDFRALYFGGEQGSAGFTGHQDRGVLWDDSQCERPVVFVTLRYRGHFAPKVAGAVQLWDEFVRIDGDLKQWRLTHHQSDAHAEIIFPSRWKWFGRDIFEVHLGDGQMVKVIRRRVSAEGTVAEVMGSERSIECVLRRAWKREPRVAFRTEWSGKPKIILQLPYPLDVDKTFGPRSLAIVTDRI